MTACGLWFHGSWCSWSLENVALSVTVGGVLLLFWLLKRAR